MVCVRRLPRIPYGQILDRYAPDELLGEVALLASASLGLGARSGRSGDRASYRFSSILAEYRGSTLRIVHR
jgi:hypothetical protein